jgi:transcriptional regulator GlxA family with amidase domain
MTNTFPNCQLCKVHDWELRAKLSKYHARALAKSCDVSLRHLERYFKCYFSVTPQEWLNRLRLKQATDLLNTNHSVKCIAYELGFKQASHFSQMFKNAYGIAPTQFRVRCKV